MFLKGCCDISAQTDVSKKNSILNCLLSMNWNPVINKEHMYEEHMKYTAFNTCVSSVQLLFLWCDYKKEEKNAHATNYFELLCLKSVTIYIWNCLFHVLSFCLFPQKGLVS